MAMNGNCTPTYDVDELRFDKFNGSFADKEHPIYVAYDADIDQLIVRLIEPSAVVPVSEYYVSEENALLVRDDNQLVVGFVVDRFEEAFLPKVPKLAEAWRTSNSATFFHTYQRIDYRPTAPRREKQPKTAHQNEVRIISYSAYQTKSARELVLA
jgi:hypothetical protein